MKKVITFSIVLFSLVGASLTAHADPHKLGPFGVDYPTFEGSEKSH